MAKTARVDLAELAGGQWKRPGISESEFNRDVSFFRTRFDQQSYYYRRYATFGDALAGCKSDRSGTLEHQKMRAAMALRILSAFGPDEDFAGALSEIERCTDEIASRIPEGEPPPFGEHPNVTVLRNMCFELHFSLRVALLAFWDSGKFFREKLWTLDPDAMKVFTEGSAWLASINGEYPNLSQEFYQSLPEATGTIFLIERPLAVLFWKWGSGVLLNDRVRAAFLACEPAAQRKILSLGDRKEIYGNKGRPKGKTDAAPRKTRVDKVGTTQNVWSEARQIAQARALDADPERGSLKIALELEAHRAGVSPKAIEQRIRRRRLKK